MNPFLEDWTAPFGAPPLDRIRPEHFPPAYAQAPVRSMRRRSRASPATPHRRISPTPSSRFEKSGKLLARVEAVFSTFAGSATNDAMQAIELEMAPRLSAHADAIYLNARLFARIDARLATTRHASGWMLNPATCWNAFTWISCAQARDCRRKAGRGWMQINQRLATLATEFSQNVLADEEDYVEPLSEAQAAGVPHILARGAGGDRQGARPGCALCRHPVALQRRAIPAIRRRPRLAREIVQGLDRRAAAMPMRTTTAPSSPRRLTLRAEKARTAGL